MADRKDSNVMADDTDKVWGDVWWEDILATTMDNGGHFKDTYQHEMEGKYTRPNESMS